MKYYVYAGYYENFISGHKLPKPYVLRDTFKTFDEALDYVWENWEDDAIFFTEDVIGDAIDNGFINDENWEDYLMEESKKSARKSIKVGDVVKNENRDDLFGLVYKVEGERITMYVIDKDTHTYNTRDVFTGNAVDYEKVNFKVASMNESKKSARKSIKESKNMTFSFKESELFVDIKHIIDSEKINLHKKISTDFVYDLNEFKDICDELCKTENLYYIVYENKTSFKGDYNLVFFDIDDVDMRRNGEITFTVISDYNKEVIKFFNE